MTELYEARKNDRAPGRSRGVTAWIAVALVAVLSGVGVATVREPTSEGAPSGASRDGARIRAITPRVIELTINPRTVSGSRIAKVAFRFTYECAARDRESVRDRVERSWNTLAARTWRQLRNVTVDDLKSDPGLERLDRELCAAFDDAVFSDGIARVQRIDWQQILVR